MAEAVITPMKGIIGLTDEVAFIHQMEVIRDLTVEVVITTLMGAMTDLTVEAAITLRMGIIGLTAGAVSTSLMVVTNGPMGAVVTTTTRS